MRDKGIGMSYTQARLAIPTFLRYTKQYYVDRRSGRISYATEIIAAPECESHFHQYINMIRDPKLFAGSPFGIVVVLNADNEDYYEYLSEFKTHYKPVS
ncbi:MAG: hypothetical protein K0S44_1661 [Bacteroidetes bacterium]|jgi:hypothetical protein|nr:hypothetical protein [Bacteroidota bacterium]